MGMDRVSEPAPARRPKTIQSVDRAAMLLKAIANARQRPTVVELAELCRLNRSTAWRLLSTLERHGLVERDPVTQRYGVGYGLLGLLAAADHTPLVRRARPVLEALARETGETVNLAIARRFELVYVDQVEPPQIMAVNWLGRSVPLHATSAGKAFLAFLAEEERDALLERKLERYTGSTVVDRRRLEKELEAVRRDGYCVCAGEFEEALVGASAPVLDRHGRPLAVVSVWGSEHRIPHARRPELGRRTVRAAGDIEARLQ
jgi:DNA-binding IclR family transcriptional regulator